MEFFAVFPHLFPVPRSKTGQVVLLAATGVCFTACTAAAMSTIARHTPRPSVYRDYTLAGLGDRDPPADPSVRIRFTNVGGGAMQVKSAHIVAHGAVHERFDSALDEPMGVVLDEPYGLLTSRCRSHRTRDPKHQGTSSSTLCTLRPESPDDPDWQARVDAALDAADLRVVVEHVVWSLPLMGERWAKVECRV